MIFDVEEFAIYDGPGIRTTVFFKGCPLRCIWCHNPEGISIHREIMVKAALCGGCGRCVKVCPRSQTPCIACGNCIDECPKHIRKICGYEIAAHELAEKLKKNGGFYKTGGGGITISGGEPFYQSAFLFALLNELKEFHRAIETSGYTSCALFVKAFDFIDLFIMDIKHADPAAHKKITGADNKQILENLGLLKESGKPFIIRIPLIPGINDGDENLYETSKLLAGSKNLLKVELLPYNQFTKTKYRSLGREYHPPFDETKEPDINISQKYFTRIGIKSVVL